MFAADPFADFVRQTDPLTPADEQKKFHLPPGFEIQLVASEPEIGKPMNMAFDARGRLWITQSREYPLPVLPVEKEGRDKILILENFDETGRAKKISTFAEGLNIPIGLYPYKNGVIAFTLPNIYFFQDTDGDGRADKKDLVLGRFGYEKDTHGLTSNFRRGYDGWIYADHGFNNDTTLTARDGSSIKMNSGNTYRFRPDGSRVEQFTHGQVNPFGLMFDHLGDLWSSDCHSSPTYLLLSGGYYPSFGKPHDGLGFAPNICAHSHGSTAIAGMVFYDAEDFPPEFRGNTFVGNVMTCKINRDSYIEHGSTRIAKEEPDFLACDDPWFRPVNLELGPDGAIYVADFYNRIIGHYEVPLTHPGRDRERGRIWRIVYRPTGKESVAVKDLARASMAEIISELGHPNIARRMLAMNFLVDQTPARPAPVRQALVKSGGQSSAADQRVAVHALWILERFGQLEEPAFLQAATKMGPLVRIHALRILAERGRERPLASTESYLSPASSKFIADALTDADAYVRRNAAETLGAWPDVVNVRRLLEAWNAAAPEDSELVYTIRKSLRDQLLSPGFYSSLGRLNEKEARGIAEVSLAVPSVEAGSFLLHYVQQYQDQRSMLADCLRHVARYAPEGGMDAMAKFTRQKFADDTDFQLDLFKSIQQGLEQRGVTPSAAIRDWGASLARTLLAALSPANLSWVNHPVPAAAKSVNPWFLQPRASSDGDKSATFVCSLPPGGEALTGILRSENFVVPPQIKFFMAGHDGPPNQPPQKKNRIRLYDSATHEVLAESAPPRNDVARPFSWDLKEHAGKQGYIDVTDSDEGRAYAWLAVGRFQPDIVPLPAVSPRTVSERAQAAADLARSLRINDVEPEFARLLESNSTEENIRAAFAKTLLALNAKAHLGSAAKILGDVNESVSLREGVGQALAELNSTEGAAAVSGAIQSAPQRLQSKLAAALAGTPTGAAALLNAIAAGKASARLLQEKSVVERLKNSKLAGANERLAQLSKGLVPADARLQKLIDDRQAAFSPKRADAARGLPVFEKNCMVCHQIDGKGAVVGPQLDGVGNRGLDRLIEDILDPNRNVDAAFHYSTVTLKDDSVVTGLFRREEGELQVFVDATGKEVSIPKNKIQERAESNNSLMPDNFSEIISSEDFNHLLAFLLSKKR
jgi:putative heme-binding domain-containing protein